MTLEEKARAVRHLKTDAEKMRRNVERLLALKRNKLAEDVALDAAALEALVVWLKDRELVDRVKEIR